MNSNVKTAIFWVATGFVGGGLFLSSLIGRREPKRQTLLVNIAKDLAAKGEILISKSRGDDELIY